MTLSALFTLTNNKQIYSTYLHLKCHRMHRIK